VVTACPCRVRRIPNVLCPRARSATRLDKQSRVCHGARVNDPRYLLAPVLHYRSETGARDSRPIEKDPIDDANGRFSFNDESSNGFR